MEETNESPQPSSITIALLEQGKSVRIVPHGTSMLPLLNGKTDSVVLRKTPAELHVGDVVMYKNAQGVFALHRIWSVDGDKYTMLGDGNVQLEHNIPKDNIYGIAAEITRGSKTMPTSSHQFKTYAALWKALYPYRIVKQKIRNALAKGR